MKMYMQTWTKLRPRRDEGKDSNEDAYADLDEAEAKERRGEGYNEDVYADLDEAEAKERRGEG